jgi:opacity protein-like surface antigen
MHIAATVNAASLPPLPPAPPLDEEPELRGSLAEESGFYMRSDAGVASGNASGLRSTYGDGSTLCSRGGVDGPVSLGNPAILGIGAGYRFNAWLRADVTGEYRPGVDYRASSISPFAGSPLCPAGRAASCGDEYAGIAKTGLFLANAYVDFGNWHGFTPYVGAGLGAAVWRTSALYPGNSFGFAPNASATNFAWDLTAGVAYWLLPNLLIDVNYRYVSMGSFRTGSIICNSLPDCHFESRSFDVASNDLRVGLRWLAIDPPAQPATSARY